MSGPLSDDVRDLLAAIREALDVPRAAHVRDDRNAYSLLRARTLYMRGALESVLESGHVRSGVITIGNLPSTYPVDYPADPGSAP